jgi:hypothetical protein
MLQLLSTLPMLTLPPDVWTSADSVQLSCRTCRAAPPARARPTAASAATQHPAAVHGPWAAQRHDSRHLRLCGGQAGLPTCLHLCPVSVHDADVDSPLGPLQADAHVPPHHPLQLRGTRQQGHLAGADLSHLQQQQAAIGAGERRSQQQQCRPRGQAPGSPESSAQPAQRCLSLTGPGSGNGPVEHRP